MFWRRPMAAVRRIFPLRRALHTSSVRLSADWRCACGFSNFASRDVCFQCHRGRAVPEAAPQRLSFRRGDWVCTCGAHNFARRERCVACDAARPSGGRDGPAAPAGSSGGGLAGDWRCGKCAFVNFRGRTSCNACGAGPSVGAWTCLSCHSPNASGGTACAVCGAERSEQRPGDWKCSGCGFHNFASRAKCKNCDLGPPEGAADPSVWVCRCGYKNFSDRTECRECKIAKP